MTAEGYESMSITGHARERLRSVHTLLLEKGVPSGIAPRKSHTWSETIEVLVAIAERELKKGKRR